MDSIYWPVLAVIGSLAGGYFGAYLKTKAANLATHEDINKLVEQLRAVTQATKEVEAKISDRVWQRQKQWELQYGAILEALRQLSEVEAIMSEVVAIHVTKLGQAREGAALIALEEKAISSRDAYLKAFQSFSKAKNVVNMLCGMEVQNRFAEIQKIMHGAVKQSITNERIPVDESLDRWAESLIRLYAAIRAQLGIEISPQPSFATQSTESSAAPSPGQPTLR
jgi:hypothetical protein